MKPNSSLKDIRYRNWMQLDTKVSRALKLLIELEDVDYYCKCTINVHLV